MSVERYSLGQLRDLGNLNPQLSRIAKRILVETYEEFVETLYEDIDCIVASLEENPELYQKDKSEDRITVEIKKLLKHIGYDASHDSKHGGHADLLVRRDTFVWIGEAKKHSSYDYLWKGFQQLTTRYSTGSSNQKEGGLLIYLFQSNAQLVMNSWQQYLSSKNLVGYSWKVCQKRSLAFFSTHTHEKSGQAFRTRHMPIMFYFNPRDKAE